MLNYKSDLSLEHLSTLAVAASIWKTPLVISRVKDFFKKHINVYLSKHQSGEDIRCCEQDWNELIWSMRSQVKATMVPKTLEAPLMSAVEKLGHRIYYFLENTAVKLVLFGKNAKLCEDIEYYMKNIRWTPWRIVDTVGTFMQRYCDETVENDSFMWYEACTYCLEDCVQDMSGTVSEKVTIKRGSDGHYEKEFVLAAYWKQQIQEESSSLLTFLARCNGHPDLHLPNNSVLEDMLLISVTLGQSEAVKYFWHQLNCQQKQQSYPNILDILNRSVAQYNYHLSFYFEPPTESYSDILAFIIEQLTDEQIQLFSNTYLQLLWMVLRWPWQSLFLKTLDKIWNLLNDDNYYYLVKCLITLISDELPGLWRDECFNLFIHLWKKLPVSLKRNINAHNIRHDRFNLSFDSLAITAAPLVRFIIADPDVHLTTMDFLRTCDDVFQRLIKNGCYQRVDSYLRKVCRTESEREEWLNYIRIEAICMHFLRKRKWKEANNLMQWKFRGNMEEIKIFKERLALNYRDFALLIENIWIKMWEQNNAKCKEAIINCVEWFTDCSSQELSMEVIKNNELLGRILKNLSDNSRFDTLDKIFSCYSLTDTEIETLKQEISVGSF